VVFIRSSLRSEREMTGSFVGEFRPRYQRNNKRSGQKNLRCFPTCGERGHMSSGFCGRFLECKVFKAFQLHPTQALRCWGEFIACGSGEERLPGAKYTLDEAFQKERTRAEPLRPWIRGEVKDEQDGSASIVFNRQLLGWHYNWVSTKHTCDSYHVFRAHVFILDQNTGILRYVESVSTPQFQLFSRRRQAAMAEQTIQEDAMKQDQQAFSANLSNGSITSAQAPGTNKMNKLDTVASVASTLATAVGNFDFTSIRTKREPGSMSEETIRFLPPKKRHLGDSLQMHKKIDRNHTLDRLFRIVMAQSRTNSLSVPEAQFLRPIDRPGSDTFTNSIMGSMMSDDFLGSRPPPMSDEEFDLLIEAALDETPSDQQVDNAHVQSLDNVNDDFDSSESDVLENLEKLLYSKGSEPLKAMVPQIISVISNLPEALVQVAGNRRDFKNFLERWSSPMGVKILTEQFAKEQKTFQLLSTKNGHGLIPDEDSENNSPEVGSEFKSIYTEIRAIYRNVVLEAMCVLGADVDDFYEGMELAARYRLINADAMFPPSKRVAALTHMHLYGHLKWLPQQDFGSRRGVFQDEAERATWVSAYWKFRRKIFRRVMMEHIVKRQQSEGMPVAPPVGCRWDISGVWHNCSSHRFKAVLSHCTKTAGLNTGDVMTGLSELSWRRIELSINQQAFQMQLERVLMSDPSYVFPLDRKPHKILLSHPLLVSPWSKERTSVAWLSQTGNGTCVVNLVTGGQTREFNVDKVITTQGDITYQSSEDSSKSSHMYSARQFILASDRETMHVQVRIHFFDAASAPSMHNFATVERLLEPGLASEAAFEVVKYIKGQDMPDVSDELLDNSNLT